MRLPRPDMPARHLPGARRRIAQTCGVATLTGALLLAGFTIGAAHDFWLVPNAFRMSPGAELVVRGQTSSLFPTSVSAVTTDRVAEAKLIGGTGARPLRDLSTAGNSLVLRHRPPGRGQYAVAVRLEPRLVRESPESFRRYLQLEGAPEALAKYEREGRLPTDSITRRYAKYAKTYVQVGAGGRRAYATPAGHPTELMPLTDPGALQVGDTLRVRLLFHGAPVAGAHIHAGAVPAAAVRTDTAAARAAASRDRSLTGDADGTVGIVIDRPGIWNVRNIHIVPAPANSGADWDVHWSTIVFHVRPGRAGRARGRTASPADSAAVLAAVRGFHHALETGDSAAALAALAPDVMILESGGVEDRAEYRGHHLPGDIAFARAVTALRTVRQVTVEGRTAWVTSTSIVQGTYKGRTINSQGAESLVLTRDGQGRWMIRSIHWSSRNRPAP